MKWPLPSWRVGHALGIPIHIHASWFLVFLLVSWTLATGYLPESLPGLTPAHYWVMGAVAAALLFGSVLLHELGHSYVALRYHIPIDRITLFIFGGVAHMRKEAPSPRAEFLIAIAGPAVSFLLGGIALACAFFVESVPKESGIEGLVILGTLLGMVNVQLGLFNLIPGFPLDGGRVLRAGLWAWGKDFFLATKQAAVVGLGFGVVLGLVGAAMLVGSLIGELPDSMASNGSWIMFIAMFLSAAAVTSRRQATLRHRLASVRVRDLMVQPVVSVPPICTLDEAVSRYFQPFGYGGFPVVEAGRLEGLVTVADIQPVPPSLWPWRQVAHVMRPASSTLVVESDVPIIDAVEQMGRGGWDRLVVLQDGQIVGLVTHSAIVRFLQLRGGSA